MLCDIYTITDLERHVFVCYDNETSLGQRSDYDTVERRGDPFSFDDVSRKTGLQS